jgi:hypothetical protein
MADPTESAGDSAESSDEMTALINQFEAETSQPAWQPAAPLEQGSDAMGDAEWIVKQSELTNKDIDLRIKSMDLEQKEAGLQKHVDQYLTHRKQELHERDLKSAIDFIRGDDLDKSFFDDKLITAFLDKSAMENQALQDAWLNRGENPRKLERILTQYAKDLRRDYAKVPDRELTEDRNMVAAAMRGSSVAPQTEPPPRYGAMSNAEFRDELKKIGIQSAI